jgi:hypothetical protein
VVFLLPLQLLQRLLLGWQQKQVLHLAPAGAVQLPLPQHLQDC